MLIRNQKLIFLTLVKHKNLFEYHKCGTFAGEINVIYN